jgi:hypothetical protein
MADQKDPPLGPASSLGVSHPGTIGHCRRRAEILGRDPGTEYPDPGIDPPFIGVIGRVLCARRIPYYLISDRDGRLSITRAFPGKWTPVFR